MYSKYHKRFNDHIDQRRAVQSLVKLTTEALIKIFGRNSARHSCNKSLNSDTCMMYPFQIMYVVTDHKAAEFIGSIENSFFVVVTRKF